MAEPSPAEDPRSVIAVTRSVDANRSLVEELERRGLVVVEVPLNEVRPPGDEGEALGRAVDSLDRYRWVVLTSANGVRAVAEALGGRPWPPGPGPAGDPVEVAAVGPTTAAEARDAGMPVGLVPERATAAALVEAFPRARPGRSNRVLAPLAELAGPTVVAGLEAKGWVVDRVEAYRTAAPVEPVPPGEAPPAADLVTFFAPSAVDRWADRFGPSAPIAVCIGPSTGARARDRGFAEVMVARPHNEAGVVDVIGRVLG
jgi:uroporphyrinogen-III synthase